MFRGAFVSFPTENGRGIGWTRISCCSASSGPECLVESFDQPSKYYAESKLEPSTIEELFPNGSDVHLEYPVEVYAPNQHGHAGWSSLIGKTLTAVHTDKEHTVTVSSKDEKITLAAPFEILRPGPFVVAPFPLKSWVKLMRYEKKPKSVGKMGEVVAHCHDGTVKVWMGRKIIQVDSSCLQLAEPEADRPKFLAGQRVRLVSKESTGCLRTKMPNQNIGVVSKWSDSFIQVMSLRDGVIYEYGSPCDLEELPALNLQHVRVIDNVDRLLEENDFKNSMEHEYSWGRSEKEIATCVAGQVGQVVGTCLTGEMAVLFPRLKRVFMMNPASVTPCEAAE